MSRTEKNIVALIAICSVCLLTVAMLKPKVDAEFHRQYSENLNELNTLIGELGRDQLQVQFGLVMHYDYIEADLQAMKKSIDLVALSPDFVDEGYLKSVNTQHAEFLQQLESVRQLIESTKRYVGLVRNSTRSLTHLFSQVREGSSKKETLTLLSEMQQGIADRRKEPEMVTLLQKLGELSDVEGDLMGQLRAHIGIVSRYSERLHQIGLDVHAEMAKMQAPQVLRAEYRNQYAQQTELTQQMARVGDGIGALLVLLCLLLVRLTQIAKKRSQEAGLQIEQQMHETHQAVGACNSVLKRIAEGDFRSRVEQTFEGDLANLCDGVNNTAERVDEAMQQLAMVMLAIENGDFSARMDATMEGALRTQVEQAMTTLEQTLSGIVSVMENTRNGCFTSRIEVDAKGDLGSLKGAVNESLDALEAAIGEITTVMQAQSQGDLEQRIERALPGQLGSLSDSVNLSTQSLSDIVRDMRKTSSALATIGEQVQHQSQSLSEHSTDQVGALAETLSSTEGMTHAITASRDLTQVATEHADAAHKRALEGEAVADKAVASIERVLLSSQKINEITDMINEIAFQTHLLSLNAAIEAARASSQGAGFGVVAQEVGLLARRCADSSSEIRKLVSTNLNQIQQGAEHVRETGGALASISTAVAQVSQIVGEINEHCAEQKTHITSVNHSISQVDSLTQHNATLAEQSLESALQLSSHAKDLQKIVNFFGR